MTNIDQCRKLLSWYCITSPVSCYCNFQINNTGFPESSIMKTTRCSISQGRNSGIEIAGFQVFFKTTIDISNVELHIYKKYTHCKCWWKCTNIFFYSKTCADDKWWLPHPNSNDDAMKIRKAWVHLLVKDTKDVLTYTRYLEQI